MANSESQQSASSVEDAEDKELVVVKGVPFLMQQNLKHSIAMNSEDIMLATGGHGNKIKLWEAHTGRLVSTVLFSTPYVNALEISPDGLNLAACGYQRIRVFKAVSDRAVVDYESSRKNVMDIGYEIDGKWMYTASEDGKLVILDTRVDLNRLKAQLSTSINASANTADLHPNQQELIAGDSEGNIHIWNLKANKREVFSPEKESVINDVSIHPGGTHLACVNNKGNCFVYPIKEPLSEVDKSLILTQASKSEEVTVPEQKKSALKSDICLDSELSASIDPPPVTANLKSNQQELIVGGSEGNISTWNLKTEKHEALSLGKESIINNVSTYPGGPHIACDNTKNKGLEYITKGPFKEKDKSAILTKVCESEKISIPAHKKYALRCKFSPDGETLVTTSADQSSKVWCTKNYTLKKELKADNQRWVWGVSFSSDSKYLFTASSDNLARLWSLERGTVVRKYKGHKNALTCLAFRDGPTH